MLQSTFLGSAAGDALMPELAPLVVLAFLGTGVLVVCAALGAGVAFAARRGRVARGLAAGGLSVAVVYSTTLAAAGLFSRDRTLAAGQRKYFCEMDCHVAYAVAGAESAGPGARALTLETWFDPGTIAPWRGDGPLTPGPREVYLVDADGRRYPPSPAATRRWENAHGASTPLGQPLRPGQSTRTTLVFELPDGARAPRLFVGDPPASVESFLIGHENGPWHGKVYLAVPESRRAGF